MKEYTLHAPIPTKIVTKEVKDFLYFFVTELKKFYIGEFGPVGPRSEVLLNKLLASYQVHLPRPHGMDCADQCRELGLVVGDTIEGTEGTSQDWEQTHRLRLIYLGHKIAVWFVTRRKKGQQIWIIEGERANWTLRDRNWAKLNNAPLICAGCGLEEGERYPQEPTVKAREDGLPRCAHCHSKNIGEQPIGRGGLVIKPVYPTPSQAKMETGTDIPTTGIDTPL